MAFDGSILINTEIQTKRASQQLATLENKMNRTAERINALKAKLNELGEQQIQTDEFAEVQQQIEEAEAKLNALTERMEKWKALGKSEDSVTFQIHAVRCGSVGKDTDICKTERDDLLQSGKSIHSSGKHLAVSGDGAADPTGGSRTDKDGQTACKAGTVAATVKQHRAEGVPVNVGYGKRWW